MAAELDLFNLTADPAPVPVEGRFTVTLETPEGFTEREFRGIVGAAYTAYTMDGQLPNVDRIYALSGGRLVSKKRIGKLIITDEFRNTMLARGVAWEDGNGLTGQQMHVLAILTNPTDRRDLTRKLKQAGVPYATYRAWLKNPAFSAYLNKVTEGMLLEHVPDFNTVLTNKALSGDINALKFVYELSGRHDPNKQQVANLQLLMQSLLEIITAEVKDPETLTRISSKFKMTLVANNIIKGEIAP